MLPTSACNVKSRSKNLPRQHQVVASKHKHLLHGRTVNYRGTSEQAQVKHITALENTNQIYEHNVQSMCVPGVRLHWQMWSGTISTLPLIPLQSKTKRINFNAGRKEPWLSLWHTGKQVQKVGEIRREIEACVVNMFAQTGPSFCMLLLRFTFVEQRGWVLTLQQCLSKQTSLREFNKISTTQPLTVKLMFEFCTS